MSTQRRRLVPIGMVADEGARDALGGVCRATIYGLVNRGELVKVNLGRRAFITADSLEAYIERLEGRAPAGAA